MKKAIVALLNIFILFAFISCNKKGTVQTVDDITPTLKVVPSVTAANLIKDNLTDNITETPKADITAEAGGASVGEQIKQEPVYSRTTQENKDFYEEVASEEDELSSFETPDYIYYYYSYSNSLAYAVDKNEDRSLYYLDEECIFIMAGNEIGPTYDYYKDMGEPIFEDFEDYIFGDKTLPFSTEIAGLISEQSEKIISGEEISLPAQYKLFNFCQGDLNSDGQNDLAVIIEQAPGKYMGSRATYVLLQNNGVYEPMFDNMSIVLGSNDGGAFGDPYDSIGISGGELYISDFGGDIDRWAHSYKFRHVGNQLILSEVTRTDFSEEDFYGTTENYDLINGKVEIKTYCDFPEDDSLNNLLLYSGKISNYKAIDFKDAYAWCDEDFEIDRAFIQPSSYDYNQKGNQLEMQHSSEEILDKVQKTYYPEMSKVDLQSSEEIINNYLLLLGYRIPAYYYTDGANILFYNGFTTGTNDKRSSHCILYVGSSGKWDDRKSYEYYDDTGEEDNSE